MEEVLYTPLVVIHVAACAFLVLVVLLQPGKSGGLGALSGAGAQQVFGGRGAGNLLTRVTWITAATFFVTSITLAFLSSSGDESLADRSVEIGVIKEAPVKAPTAEEKQAEEEKNAKPEKPEVDKESNEGKSGDTDSTEDGKVGDEPEEDEATETESPGDTDQPAEPRTPSAPLPPTPNAPKPAAPKPAAPAPAAPAPAAPAPAAPAPAAPGDPYGP